MSLATQLLPAPASFSSASPQATPPSPSEVGGQFQRGWESWDKSARNNTLSSVPGSQTHNRSPLLTCSPLPYAPLAAYVRDEKHHCSQPLSHRLTLLVKCGGPCSTTDTEWAGTVTRHYPCPTILAAAGAPPTDEGRGTGVCEACNVARWTHHTAACSLTPIPLPPLAALRLWAAFCTHSTLTSVIIPSEQVSERKWSPAFAFILVDSS